MLALIAYSIAIVTEQRRHLATNTVVIFFSLGIILDITATAFMIAGSTNTPFTLHGLLGYSALLGMLIDTGLIWRHRLKSGKTARVPDRVHLYSLYAYIWWILAFITGGALVLFK